jgi:type VI protein secretion system component Hcp
VEEQRKHAILFEATLLCVQKLIETIDSDKPNLAKQYFVDKAIQEAEFILERIDKKHP